MVEFTSEARSWNFLWGDFLITNSTLLFDIGLLRCSISSWVTFDSFFFFVGICPLHHSFLIFWHAIVDGLIILFLSVRSIMELRLSFMIVLIWFFSLIFFICQAKCLSILLIFSKNHCSKQEGRFTCSHCTTSHVERLQVG